MSTLVFPFSEYWWFYLTFTGLILALLLIDLGLFHRKEHDISIPEALVWTAVWVALALVFNVALFAFSKHKLTPVLGAAAEAEATRLSLEFLAGYVVEKALSVDNIFVFVVIFRFFGTPTRYQHRVLFLGILGALIFRSLFIITGSFVVEFESVMIAFGLFLIFTGLKTALSDDDEVDPSRNPVLKLLKRYLPVTDKYHSHRMFTREDSRWVATPLLVTLIVIECTDILFAVDSVPAIFGVTREPLIVFTSNMFAILGLRALYFVLAGMMERFHLLKYGLGAVLTFVGVKMVLLDPLGTHGFPITWSLGIILCFITASVFLSLAFPAKEDNELPIAEG